MLATVRLANEEDSYFCCWNQYSFCNTIYNGVNMMKSYELNLDEISSDGFSRIKQ